MMKKSITLLLSLALSFAAFGTLTACEQDPPAHTHSYVDGTCSCGEKDPNAKPENPDPENPGTTTTTVTEAEWNASFNLGTNFTIVAQGTDGSHAEKYTEKRAGNLYESSYGEFVNGELDGHETHNFYEEKDGVMFYYIPHYNLEEFLDYYDIQTRNETMAEVVEETLSDYIPAPFRAMSTYTYNETTKKYEAETVTVGQATVKNVAVSFENKKLTGFSYEITYGQSTVLYSFEITYGDASITLPTNVQGSLAPGYDQPATSDALASITETQFAEAFDFGTNYSATIDLTYPASIDEEDEHYFAKRNGNLFETGEPSESMFYEYDSNLDKIYAYYPPQTDGGSWTKVAKNNDSLYELENMLLVEFLNPAFTYKSNFTYDATKNAWTAQTIEISMGDSTAAYTNVEIYFNKLLKASTMEYDFAYGSMSAHFTLAIEYGKTTVTLPTNVQGGQGIDGGGVSKPDYSDYQIKDEYYWELALSGEDAGSYECNMLGYEDGALTNHMTMGVTNTIIYMETFNSTGDSLGAQYFEKVEENGTVSYYIYGYDTQLKSWHKANGNELIFNSVNMTQFTVHFLDYESFEFNEKTLSYVQTGEIITVHNETITNAELKFENGKLVSLSFTVNGVQQGQPFSQDCVITFNYDETLNYFDDLPEVYTDYTQNNN